MVMIAHEAPGEDRPAVEIADLSQDLHKLDRLEIVVENKLTASNAAVHVIGGSRNE
jgi:hypothetical protein